MTPLRFALAVCLPLHALSETAPTGLLVNFQTAPALGVGFSPVFGWIVPACASTKDAMQSAYRITVRKDGAGTGATPVWDSGKVCPCALFFRCWGSGKLGSLLSCVPGAAQVASNASVAVKYTGAAPLAGGTAYQWTVQTWLSGCPASAGSSSAPSLFITALGSFQPGAQWVGAGVDSSTFNLVRRVVKAPAAPARRVIGYITAQNSVRSSPCRWWSDCQACGERVTPFPPSRVASRPRGVRAYVPAACVQDPVMLMNYKLYVDGALASVGPGRGEAPVTGGDGRFRAQPYVTVDLTTFFARKRGGAPTLLALQVMEFGGFQPCPPHKECNGATQISHGPAGACFPCPSTGMGGDNGIDHDKN
jgi:hypothetical protein